MKLAVIKIPMSSFEVDVAVCSSPREYILFLQKRYGIPEHELDDNDRNYTQCCTMYSYPESELKGHTRFLIRLKKMPGKDTHVFIHELWHLMWHVSNVIGDFKLTRETQGWAANMIEKLFVDIMEAKYEDYAV